MNHVNHVNHVHSRAAKIVLFHLLTRPLLVQISTHEMCVRAMYCALNPFIEHCLFFLPTVLNFLIHLESTFSQMLCFPS